MSNNLVRFAISNKILRLGFKPTTFSSPSCRTNTLKKWISTPRKELSAKFTGLRSTRILFSPRSTSSDNTFRNSHAFCKVALSPSNLTILALSSCQTQISIVPPYAIFRSSKVLLSYKVAKNMPCGKAITSP